MGYYFDRVIEINFPELGKSFDGKWDDTGKRPWRIEFEVVHKLTEYPNLAIIKIYNARRDTREILAEENTLVNIHAGYQDIQSEIFTGRLRLEKTLFKGTDIISVIEAGDGDEGYQYGIFSKKYESGKNEPEKVVTDISKKLSEFDIGTDRIDVPGKATKKGRSYSGRITNVLNQIARETDTVWNIQDSIFSMYPKDDPIKPKPVYLLDRETGMIGVPEQTDIGINVLTNMNPYCRPGLVVVVDSVHFGKKNYRIETVKYVGNNYDGPHHSNLELRELEGGVVVRSINRHAGL